MRHRRSPPTSIEIHRRSEPGQVDHIQVGPLELHAGRDRLQRSTRADHPQRAEGQERAAELLERTQYPPSRDRPSSPQSTRNAGCRPSCGHEAQVVGLLADLADQRQRDPGAEPDTGQRQASTGTGVPPKDANWAKRSRWVARTTTNGSASPTSWVHIYSLASARMPKSTIGVVSVEPK